MTDLIHAGIGLQCYLCENAAYGTVQDQESGDGMEMPRRAQVGESGTRLVRLCPIAFLLAASDYRHNGACARDGVVVPTESRAL